MDTSKPIAWVNKDDSSLSFKNHGGGWEPLYTHPVKAITDEKIKALWKPMPDTKTYESDVLKFARAVIKEVSGK